MAANRSRHLREPRLPFAPLEALVRAQHREADITDREIAIHLDIPRGNVYYYRKAGVPLTVAEDLADRIVGHPLLVWPEYIDVVLAMDPTGAADGAVVAA